MEHVDGVQKKSKRRKGRYGKRYEPLADRRSRRSGPNATYEGRSYGIRVGTSVQEARRRCPQLALVEGTYSKYTETSARIFSLLSQYTPLVEEASIDEGYLDITRSQVLFKSPLHIAQSIKADIRDKEQLTCTVGVAPNKLLAKLGSRLKKPHGLIVIEKGDIEKTLKDLPAGKLFGTGPKLEKELNAISIFTCSQIAKYPVEILTKWFGIIGERLHEMGLGLDDSPVVASPKEDAPQSISHNVPLEEDTSDVETLEKVLLELSERVSKRMRRGSFYCSRVVLTVRYSDFCMS